MVEVNDELAQIGGWCDRVFARGVQIGVFAIIGRRFGHPLSSFFSHTGQIVASQIRPAIWSARC